MRTRSFAWLELGLPLLALVAAATVSACDLADNLEDLGGSLLNPDAELLEIPGRQLARGHYSQLELDGSLESGGWVVAKRHDLDEEAVSIISFTGDGQCELPGALQFRRISSRVDLSLPGLLAYERRDQDGTPIVDFAGFDCTNRLTPVRNGTLPNALFPRSSPRGLLLLTHDGRLLLVDAFDQKLRDIATEVAFGVIEGQPGGPGTDRLWIVRGHGDERELAVFDVEFEQVGTFPGIDHVLLLNGWPEYDAVVTDAEGLHFLSLENQEKELIDADGCAPVSLGGQLLAYFAPCSERRLRLSVPGALVGREEERFTIELGPNAIAPSDIIAVWQGENSFLFYLVNPDDPNATAGELRLAERLGADPEDRTDADRRLAFHSHLHGQLIFLDWNGTSGTMARPKLTIRTDDVTVRDFEGLTVIAEKVVPAVFYPYGTLINYDGTVGDLVRIVRSGDEYEHTPLVSGVPLQVPAVDPASGTFAIVGDYAHGAGTAYLVTGDTARPVGDDVLPNTLAFLEQPYALTYLARDGSHQTAELRAWLIDTELDVRVSERVSEYRGLPWPSAGLLYAIPSGDRAGLWFARAR